MERLGWNYRDIVATPPAYLPLCEKFRWRRIDLLAVPAQALRDFQVIFDYERDLAKSSG